MPHAQRVIHALKSSLHVGEQVGPNLFIGGTKKWTTNKDDDSTSGPVSRRRPKSSLWWPKTGSNLRLVDESALSVLQRHSSEPLSALPHPADVLQQHPDQGPASSPLISAAKSSNRLRVPSSPGTGFAEFEPQYWRLSEEELLEDPSQSAADFAAATSRVTVNLQEQFEEVDENENDDENDYPGGGFAWDSEPQKPQAPSVTSDIAYDTFSWDDEAVLTSARTSSAPSVATRSARNVVHDAFRIPSGANATSSSRLLSQFRIVEEIGRGAFGVVFKAEDVLDAQEYALKVIPSNSASQEFATTLEECRVMAALSPHPNVVGYKSVWKEPMLPVISKMLGDEEFEDWQEADCIIVIKMELYTTDLREFLRSRQGDVDPKTLLRVMRDLMLGVSHVHRKGLLHRDIKPRNVFLLTGKSGGIEKAALGDFGLATFDPEEGNVGTRVYAAPEQLCPGQPQYDQRVDVFSLGMLLFELFSNWTTESERLLRFRQLRAMGYCTLPGFPAVADIVGRACKMNPEERLDSHELLDLVSTELAKFSTPNRKPEELDRNSLISEVKALRQLLKIKVASANTNVL